MSRYLIGLIAVLFFFSSGCREEEGSVPVSTGPGGGSGSTSVKLIQEEFNGIPIVVAGSSNRNLIVAFSREVDGAVREFTPVQGQLPVIMEDEQGNRWNVFGKATFGPDKGAQLGYVNSGVGYWFVFGAFYPGLDLWGIGERSVNISPDTSADWQIPTAYVGQGTGFDGIPALDEPPFINYSPISIDPDHPFYMEDEDLVIVVSQNGETKIYPHKILDWHEVINDEVGGTLVTVTYCPLTGTGKVWKRSTADMDAGFGVSGLLYNSNLLSFDRATESFWHQLEATAVFGDRMEERLELLPFVETSWGTWRGLSPSPLIMSEETGYNRDYTDYPYGDYKSSALVAYPLLYDDDRLPKKQRVFSVIVNGKARVYQFSDF
ncbi:MAG: DUF3179 domain-containing (seleno)protein [Phaeodactylibacter sp.]|uniref:DUF3179 domain-containing protein n=1 Tax=Phaeodactylibacter sp. TaxID=1940289 RepID=UPI0032EFE672